MNIFLRSDSYYFIKNTSLDTNLCGALIAFNNYFANFVNTPGETDQPNGNPIH